ncbi:MDR family MFS transporter [Paenibacillus eucommiae]|uniref:EmrB/QacA subfamily drug resistance transporter n=1 Tax=Paenibacillus eucommiae TaxID=1355755 RepID=A0ABS4IYU9_9BACL|nr:MDR family MFS transporter [Paenibacillus eucommiae]MBP1992765.1 EmrB/QacA subfamily drug resistance transporter [Paenibacillus eucommiae]
MNKQTNRLYVTIGIFVVTLLAAIEGTIVNTAIPTIVSQLGGIKSISWVISIYLLTAAVTTPIYGKLADLYGRKNILSVGIILFLIGAVLAGSAQTMGQLIGYRAFQGIGAGAILTLTFTIVGDLYTNEERGKIQGMISGVWGVAGVLGPMTGGFLVDFVSWRWIFYMNLPFGIVALLLIGIFLRENLNTEKKKLHIDYGGAITFTISMTTLMYALLTGGSTYAWQSPEMLGFFIIIVLSFAAFIYFETKSPDPMLPFSLFRNRMLAISFMNGFFLSVILAGITFYTPIWMQGILGTGATGAGFALIPLSLTWPFGALLGGRLATSKGSRTTAILGNFILLIGFIALTFLSESSPLSYLYTIMGIVGFGFGISLTVFTLSIQSAVNWNLRGAANGANNFIRGLGQTMGVACLAILFNSSISNFLSRNPGLDMNKMLNAADIQSFPMALVADMRATLSSGLNHIFIVLAFISVLALLSPLFLPNKAKEKAAQH